ncbi:membrane protein [Bradyrhizobium sp. LTSP857]|uniref:membrane protein n=1 Tax=Bradyrhizobium sp. LTSP857 TaxID=1619231 RepID=UPI0005D25508|nr:membrane protein [Bradyrhizobium sp. LTSP857]KJC52101.1 membrane protein [Bradyrhizobium sp. LTSP857]
MAHDQLNLVRADRERWLKSYYFIRAAFSVAWVVAAFVLAPSSAVIAGALLVLYPAWDAAANLVDALRSGGLNQNRTQALNVLVSLATAVTVIVALQTSMNWVLGVFGAWAILSGLLQLGTAIRRWKSFGAQWAMVLSGGQSALAGGFFIVQAATPAVPSIANVAGYAGVGALYFLVSAVWLAVSEWRQRART